MRILLTRPEPDGARTAQALRARGHDVLLAPMLSVEPVADAPFGSGPWAAVLVTSANAVRAVAGHPLAAQWKALPVLAVGEGSAMAAREAGFGDVASADGDGADLARLAASRFKGAHRPLLYLAGEDRARDLAGLLAGEGIAVETVAVYRAVPAADFPPQVRAALEDGTIDAVAHFSRRSASAYLHCAAQMGERALAPLHLCLSEQAAGPLRAAGVDRIAVAARPDEAALLELAGSPQV